MHIHNLFSRRSLIRIALRSYANSIYLHSKSFVCTNVFLNNRERSLDTGGVKYESNRELLRFWGFVLLTYICYAHSTSSRNEHQIFPWGKMRSARTADSSAVLFVPNIKFVLESEYPIPPVSLHVTSLESFLPYLLYW